MSFKQIDSTNDALSVKKTRPSSYVQSALNMRRDSKVEILSPPREESVGENRNMNPRNASTPLKSSLKSWDGRNSHGSPKHQDVGNTENVNPIHNDAIVEAKSSPTSFNSLHSINRLIEPLSVTATRKLSTPTKRCSGYVRGDNLQGNLWSRIDSEHRMSSGISRNMTQVDGSPERPQPSYDLDPVVAHQVGPSFKVLKALSTVRSQPKIPHVDPEATPSKLRSSVWRSSSRGSATSGNECGNEQVKEQLCGIRREIVNLNQTDGAGDSVPLSYSFRISHQDLKEDLIKRNKATSFLPIAKSRPHGLEIQTKLNHVSPPSIRRNLAKPLLTDQAEVTPSANKVRGLAAMFDTAAKASPFVPTPGGAIQKKRRETTGVISPYTSNPSPCAPIQPFTSVSTPASFMSPSKSGMSLLGATGSIGKRSSIPRDPKSPPKEYIDRTDNPDKQLNSSHTPRNGAHLSGASSVVPCRIPTPSCLPSKKQDSGDESTFPPQLDGSNKTLRSLLRLTPQHSIRSSGYSPSILPQIPNGSGLECLPRLPQYSTESLYSDDDTGEQRQDFKICSSGLSRDRNSSSLRDRIRSLRSELSAKNMDYTQLRAEFEEYKKMKDLSEVLLRENVDRARAEVVKWKRQAETAERKVEQFERLAVRIRDERQLDRGCYQAQGYSYLGGSGHIDTAEQSSQPLVARMNQSAKRMPKADDNFVCLSNSIGGDLSDCSENTILRNITGTSRGEESIANGSRLWNAMDGLVDFACLEPADKPL